MINSKKMLVHKSILIKLKLQMPKKIPKDFFPKPILMTKPPKDE